MGKLGRGVRWAGFAPAGLIASVRDRKRKSYADDLEVIRIKEVADRMRAAGLKRGEVVGSTKAAMDLVREGETVDAAVASVLAKRSA